MGHGRHVVHLVRGRHGWVVGLIAHGVLELGVQEIDRQNKVLVDDGTQLYEKEWG